jgi:hypothetical protein
VTLHNGAEFTELRGTYSLIFTVGYRRSRLSRNDGVTSLFFIVSLWFHKSLLLSLKKYCFSLWRYFTDFVCDVFSCMFVPYRTVIKYKLFKAVKGSNSCLL